MNAMEMDKRTYYHFKDIYNLVEWVRGGIMLHGNIINSIHNFEQVRRMF